MDKLLCLLFSPFLFCTSLFAIEANFHHEIANKARDSCPHKIVRRAAFDIGSGKVKMQVSDVDITAGKIVTVLFTDNIKVALREDLGNGSDGRLSAEIQNKLMKAISKLMKKAALFHPTAYHAIATEALRIAKNGEAVVNRIEKETGLPITIISQEEEGILGFVSAINQLNIDPDKVVTWDFGGGSFQLATQYRGDFYVYQGRLGKIPFRDALLQIQGKDVQRTKSPNPIAREEFAQAIQWIKENMKDIPVEILHKLSQSDVVVLSIGIHPLHVVGVRTNYDQSHILQEIEKRLSLDDAAIRIKDSIEANNQASIPYIVSNLILTYGIMHALDINKVKYVGTPAANAIGTLLMPKYWNANKE